MDRTPPPHHHHELRIQGGCGLFWILFLAFTALPLIELALLLQVHGAIGLEATLALVLLTGTTGAALARWQGLKTFARVRESMAQGRLPGQALFDGALILFAGALLVTPGVLTDAVGFALLVPAVRRLVGRGLRRLLGASGPAKAPDDVFDAEVVSSRAVEPEPPAALDVGGHEVEP